MIKKFYVIKRKDGKYLRYNESRYGRSWSCTNDILSAKKYSSLNYETFASDVQAYLARHKNFSIFDFSPVYMVASFNKTQLYVDAASNVLFNISDFWARSESGYIYHITEGDGTNLDEEDEEEGYVDYIYFDTYDENGEEIDGGMWLLEKPYTELSLDEIFERFDEPKMTVINEPEWADEV